MAAVNTNSNSMTTILVVALNNKKSGFRNQFFKLLNLKDDDYQFEDGTHSVIGYKEINDKKVDIVGKLNGKIALFIEIKVNNNETLQESQCEDGEYKKVCDKYNIGLIYIIPDAYAHKAEIPNSATQIKWTDILKLAEEYDNTCIENYIKTFVDLPIDNGSILLTKGELFMLMNQKSFVSAMKLKSAILKLTEEIPNYITNIKDAGENDEEIEIGRHFTCGKFMLFIGLNYTSTAENFFSVVIEEYPSNYKNLDNYSSDKDDYFYIPFSTQEELFQQFSLADTEEEQQEKFIQMVINILSNLGLKVSKKR